MDTASNIDLTFDQVLAIVKRLPTRDKIKLSKELEKEGIQDKLTRLLKTFQTDALPIETIDEEVEIVRQKIYESQKH